MNKLLLASTAVSLIAFTSNAVLVDGYCFLEGCSNHTDSKILFQAQPGTAVSDSTYTDINGYYRIDSLSIGAYDIYFSHEGFYDEEMPDMVLITNTTLPNVNLSAIGVPIFGPQSGVLPDTTYLVIDDISVESGDSLIIEPGTILRFNGNYSFTVNGYLYAVGTEVDSIVFIPSPTTSNWGGVDFNDSANDSCRLEYCFITGSNSSGIDCDDSELIIIRNCAIIGNFVGAYQWGGGIHAYNSNLIIEKCNINNNSAYIGGGVSCSGTITISKSIFYGNNGCSISCNSGPIYINNCTLSDNSSGIRINNNSSTTIVNVIIEGSSGYGIHFESITNTSITHCDFYNNSGGNFTGYNIPPYLGVICTTNTNGDSCDVYSNIFLDPLFYSTIDDSAYYLTAESPCIDAGDLNSPLDPDSTIADIGAFYYDQSSAPSEPDIDVSTNNLNFGLVPVGNLFDLPIMIYSVGDTVLAIMVIYTSNADFYIDFDPADSLIAPGDSLEVIVTFEPSIERMYDETLYIVSNAVNDTITVSLYGDGGAVPDSVQNLVITLEYPDAVLTWDEVTTSVSGYPLEVNYYLLYFETDAYDEYEFLAYTTGTTYNHAGVMQFAPSMFYFVEAYVGDIELLEAAVAVGKELSQGKMHELLGLSE